MCRHLTVSLLFALFLLADLLVFKQTYKFWRTADLPAGDNNILFLLLAQSGIAIALIISGSWLFYKFLLRKKKNLFSE